MKHETESFYVAPDKSSSSRPIKETKKEDKIKIIEMAKEVGNKAAARFYKDYDDSIDDNDLFDSLDPFDTLWNVKS